MPTYQTHLTRIVKLCEADDSSEEAMRFLAASCHETLLMAPDEAFYGTIRNYGWNGVSFASPNVDLMDLASDLAELLETLPLVEAVSPSSQLARIHVTSKLSASDEPRLARGPVHYDCLEHFTQFSSL